MAAFPPPSAPAIAFAMTYPDTEGNVWNGINRVYDRLAGRLAAEGYRSLAVYPQLTDRPAFRHQHMERHELDLCHAAATPWEKIAAFAREQHVRAAVFMDIHPHQARVAAWRKLGVATISNEQYSYDDDARVSAVKGWLKALRNRLPSWHYDLHVANSRLQYELMLAYAKLDRWRLRLAVNGVDEQAFAPAPAPEAAALGLPATEHYAVMVCQARPEKRIGFLIEVAAEVFKGLPSGKSEIRNQKSEIQDHPSLTFVYVGDGPCRAAWQARAAEAGLAGRFVFAGQQADVRPFLRRADVLLHAASRESFGFGIAEAMACGLPVICSNRGGPREIIAPGETGYLVEPDDRDGYVRALLEVLDDAPRRRRMGEQARRRVCERFTLDRQIADWVGILHEALGMVGT